MDLVSSPSGSSLGQSGLVGSNQMSSYPAPSIDERHPTPPPPTPSPPLQQPTTAHVRPAMTALKWYVYLTQKDYYNRYPGRARTPSSEEALENECGAKWPNMTDVEKAHFEHLESLDASRYSHQVRRATTAAAVAAAAPNGALKTSTKFPIMKKIMKKKKSRPKPVKIQGQPTRPMSAFFYFLRHGRSQIQVLTGAPYKNFVQDMGEKWRRMSDDEKSPFLSKYAEAKAKFDEETKLFWSKRAGIDVDGNGGNLSTPTPPLAVTSRYDFDADDEPANFVEIEEDEAFRQYQTEIVIENVTGSSPESIDLTVSNEPVTQFPTEPEAKGGVIVVGSNIEVASGNVDVTRSSPVSLKSQRRRKNKRPYFKTAYQWYMDDTMKSLSRTKSEANMDNDAFKASISTQLNNWKKLSAKEREKYEQLAAEARMNYNDMANVGAPTCGTSSSVSSVATASKESLIENSFGPPKNSLLPSVVGLKYSDAASCVKSNVSGKATGPRGGSVAQVSFSLWYKENKERIRRGFPAAYKPTAGEMVKKSRALFRALSAEEKSVFFCQANQMVSVRQTSNDEKDPATKRKIRKRKKKLKTVGSTPAVDDERRDETESSPYREDFADCLQESDILLGERKTLTTDFDDSMRQEDDDGDDLWGNLTFDLNDTPVDESFVCEEIVSYQEEDNVGDYIFESSFESRRNAFATHSATASVVLSDVEDDEVPWSDSAATSPACIEDNRYD